jgi:hypothetical protein
LAAAGDVSFEDYNGLTPGTDLDPISLSLDGFDIDATGVADFDIEVGTAFNAIDGTTFLDVQVTETLTPLTFNFPTPVTAFGATFGSANSLAGLEFLIDGSFVADTNTLGVSTDFSDVTFIGLVSDAPFSSLSLDYLGPGFSEIFAHDNVYYTLVPEPAMAGLLAIGGLTLLRRRR